MSIAFHGDATLQDRMVAQLARHRADGSLTIGETRWDGRGGSPLGVLTHDTSIDTLATLSGYPLALAGLFDPLADLIRDADAAFHFCTAWLAGPEAGANLSTVPASIAIDLLDLLDPALVVGTPIADVRALHRRTAAGDDVSRAEWSACRTAMIAIGDAKGGNVPRPALDLLEAAAWPARDSRSSIATMVAAWCNLAEFDDSDDWTAADEEHAQAMLRQLWDENSDRREAGAAISYPTLFAQRDAALAERFEANLDHVNRRYQLRIGNATTLVLARLQGARA